MADIPLQFASKNLVASSSLFLPETFGGELSVSSKKKKKKKRLKCVHVCIKPLWRELCKSAIVKWLCEVSTRRGLGKAPIEMGLHIHTSICTFQSFPTDTGVLHKTIKR